MKKIVFEEHLNSLDEDKISVYDNNLTDYVVAGNIYDNYVIAQPDGFVSDKYVLVILDEMHQTLNGYSSYRTLNKLLPIHMDDDNKFYAFDSWQEAFLWLVSQDSDNVDQLVYTIDNNTTITGRLNFCHGTGSIDDNDADDKIFAKSGTFGNEETSNDIFRTEDFREYLVKYYIMGVDRAENRNDHEGISAIYGESVLSKYIPSIQKMNKVAEDGRRILNELTETLSKQIRDEEDSQMIKDILNGLEDTYLFKESSTMSNPYSLEQQLQCLKNEKKRKKVEQAKTELGLLLDEMENLNKTERVLLELLK